jgi:23S rRNA pseudouridine1911/1915/1917 synthase
LPAGANEVLRLALRNFKRQALHAQSLEFKHPRTGEDICVNAELPDDFAELLSVLRANAGSCA